MTSPFIAASGGENFSLALQKDGSLWSWSYDSSHDKVYLKQTVPQKVLGLSGEVKALATGYDHSIVLMKDGSVATFDNDYDYGQSETSSQRARSVPLKIANLKAGVKAVAAGGYHVLALLEDGRVKAWGDNGFGQLGDGTNKKTKTPVRLTKLRGKVKAIAAGSIHSLALLEDGSVFAWGGNDFGQLGFEVAGRPRHQRVPRQIKALSGVRAIAAGGNYSLALLEDGSLWAWGDNMLGQLGDGTPYNQNKLVEIKGLKGQIQAIKVGWNHSLALLKDGSLMGWGNNEEGQLGTKREIEIAEKPIKILADKSLIEVIFSPASGRTLGLYELEVAVRSLAQEEIAI